MHVLRPGGGGWGEDHHLSNGLRVIEQAHDYGMNQDTDLSNMGCNLKNNISHWEHYYYFFHLEKET